MLFQDHHDLLSAFLHENVEFLVYRRDCRSGVLVSRATGDLDVWVNPTPENAGRVVNALIRFCAPMDRITMNDFMDDRVVQIGLPPARVNIMTSIEGVVFTDAYPKRLEVKMDGLVLPVISREDLIRNKTSTGRNKDLGDVDRLEAFAAKTPTRRRR